MTHPHPLPNRRSLSGLVGCWALFAAPLTACDPEEGGGKKGTVDSGTEVELPPFPEEVLGVPNLDDDNEDGEQDWDAAIGTDDEQVPVEIDPTVWEDLEADTTITVTFEGELDLIRVWSGSTLLLDESTTTASFDYEADLSGLSVEFAAPLAAGQLVFEASTGESWTTLLQAAPLILNHHLQPAEWVNAVNMGGGAYGNAAFINTFTNELGSDFKTVEGGQVGWDPWMQDEIEFGTFTAPGYRMDFVLDSIRSSNPRSLDPYAEAYLFGPDFGMGTFGEGRPTSQDSFGNLEVSPPVTVDGVDYPFGRIYYGDSRPYDMADGFKDMLAAQQVQAPFTLEIEWLCVGHVDEFITMLPDPDAPKGFRVWVADIDEGRAFLETMPASKSLPKYNSDHHYGSAGEMLSDNSLWNYNRDLMDEYIEPSISKMKQELGLDESDFVRIPGLFESSRACGGVALALIPATANMQVSTHDDGVNADLFIPDPFLRGNGESASSDPFVQDFEALLPSNLNPIWTDDWNSYHMAWGEVHCGSNTVRTPVGEWWTDARHLLED
jgi:protein-arginine deiminase